MSHWCHSFREIEMFSQFENNVQSNLSVCHHEMFQVVTWCNCQTLDSFFDMTWIRRGMPNPDFLKSATTSDVESVGPSAPNLERCWRRDEDEDEDDALTAGPPGRRSSVRQYQNSYCTTTCASDIKHQAVRLGPEDSTVNINKAPDKNTKIARPHNSIVADVSPFFNSHHSRSCGVLLLSFN